MNLLRHISVHYADGRLFEGELAEQIRIPNERQPFENVSAFHIRAIAQFKPVQAKLKDGRMLSITPDRVEAKVGDRSLPPLVTIECQGERWETFWADISGVTKPRP